MAILRPPLLPLGLLLCLWLLCSPASCTNPTAKCKPICSVTNKRPSYIDIYPRGYESNKLYTVSLIVEPNITSVILEARDQNNSVIGSWQNPSQSCEGRAEYNLKGQIRTLFEAKWMSPKSMNISSVMIYIYCTTFLRHAELAVLILSRVGAPSAENTKHFPVRSITSPGHRPTPAPRKPTPAPPKPTPDPPKPTTSHPTPTTPHPTPTTPPTTPHPTPTMTQEKPTTTHHKHTTKNSANRAFLSPVREAIQILLIFLTSTLLF
ncbi:placenta-expressed transcript 1 protein-like [Cervus elaphus]|uniref:placenta-expressed transcript 1 protein-like n=1 Tax=Cervus canadensis TaxID=1574408 RepID=UPI001C9E466A|nr:placenta-expressed transcript 1 protein-like [Cervus canadensis]XP_043755206.1 placenta-expressed transcript 1 protein-like [Cervus elaphus]